MWTWIAGYRDGVWLPLYCFKPERHAYMRGVLLALLTADEDSPLYADHKDYEDFRIERHDDTEGRVVAVRAKAAVHRATAR